MAKANGKLVGGCDGATVCGCKSPCVARVADVRLRLAARELPAGYDGYLPERVEVSLRPALRWKFRAIFDALVADRAAVSAPAGSEPPDKPMFTFP